MFLLGSLLQEWSRSSSHLEVQGQNLNWNKTVKFIGPKPFHNMVHSKALRTYIKHTLLVSSQYSSEGRLQNDV